MKLGLFFLTLFFVSAGVCSGAEYRDFLDKKGRTVRGRILRYDELKNQVTIERDNRKVATVPVAVFDDADQEYILEWAEVQEFLNDSTFKIDAKRDREDDERASFENSNSEMDVEKHSYEIELENRSTVGLENLKLNYCIYYEQDEIKNKEQTTGQGIFCGSLDLPDIGPRSERTLKTEPIKIYKRTLDSSWYYYSGVKNVQDGDVHGVWIRVSMETKSGNIYSRDYCLPDSIPNSRKWTTKSVAVGMNK